MFLRLFNSSLDCEIGWRPIQLGDRELCSKDAGFHITQDARQICADLGAKLPLPKSEAEYEDLRAIYGNSGVAIDATDLNQDGIWEDSSGNVVEYLAEIWTSPTLPGPYLETGQASSLDPRPESEFVYKAYYAQSKVFIHCLKKPVYEPPTPVAGDVFIT